jgi:hypothetical protein
MNIKSELTKSRFLSKADVEPPITATIDEVAREKIAVPGERPETKFCVYFKEANLKPLILNKTNGDKIAAMAGSYETDDWSGVKVELYLEPNVDFGGQLTGGIGIGERTYHDWVQNNPAFAAATREARARAKIKLVAIISKAAKTDARHAEWLLERSWPAEYSRVTVERVEQIGDEPKTVGVNIFYDTGGEGIEKLLAFPTHPSMMQSQTEVEQANVPAENAADTDNDEAPEPINEAPPKVVDKRLTGRIHPEWKSNYGQP